VTSATLLRQVARSHGYPGRRMALSVKALSPPGRRGYLATITRSATSEAAATLSPSGIQREIVAVTHFESPVERHGACVRAALLPHLFIAKKQNPCTRSRDSHSVTQMEGKGQRAGELAAVLVATRTRLDTRIVTMDAEG